MRVQRTTKTQRKREPEREALDLSKRALFRVPHEKRLEQTSLFERFLARDAYFGVMRTRPSLPISTAPPSPPHPQHVLKRSSFVTSAL